MKEKMIAKAKRRILVIGALTIVLTLSMTLLSMPGGHAATITPSEKGMSILHSVIGLDTAKYTANITEKNAPPYLGTVPQEDINYNLGTNESSVKTLMTFLNGTLQMIQVLEKQGIPSLISNAPIGNAMEMAQQFLKNYYAYTGNQIYAELQSSLKDVVADTNLTKPTTNALLEVNAIKGYTTFKWTYSSNEAVAPSKFIALGFNDSFLTAFVDNWQPYNVGSTSVTLSKTEAAAIALRAANDHFNKMNLGSTWNLNSLNETNIRWTKLVFDNSLNATTARSEDALELFPVWRVGIALDKWYGQLYGVEVDIWGDTKEIRYIQDAYSTLPQEDPSMSSTPDTTSAKNLATAYSSGFNSLQTMSIIIIAASTATTMMVWATRKKASSDTKAFLRKLSVLLLCLLTLSIMLSPIGTAKASKAAIAFGSESTGAYDPNFPPQYNWRKSLNERSLQQSVASTIIWSDFNARGYTGYNYQGGSSVKNTVLAMLSSLHSTYTNLAIVDFDHGIGRHDYSLAPNEFHFMFEDEVGTGIGSWASHTWNPQYGVYDMDIYPRVGNGQVTFAFINTCMSANTTNPENGQPWNGPGTYGARGMPYAVTHRIVKYLYSGDFNVANDISSYGYQYPDTGSQVYIGFYYGSASLEQRVPYNTGPQYYHWVTDFFNYGLNYGMSVYQALDHASWVQYGVYFGNSPLWTGFTSYWYNNPTMNNCRMAVYGNSNIVL